MAKHSLPDGYPSKEGPKQGLLWATNLIISLRKLSKRRMLSLLYLRIAFTGLLMTFQGPSLDARKTQIAQAR